MITVPIRLNKCYAMFVALFVMMVSLNAQTDTIQTTVPALKNVYANDFYIGCILSYRHIGFANDPKVPGQSNVIAPNGGRLVQFHMNSMTPGNNMKAQYTIDITGSAAAYNVAPAGAARDSVNLHPIVRFNGDMIAQLNWAQRQGFKFRGHTLVWHSQSPREFFFTGYNTSGARLTKEQMTVRMDNYIHDVIKLIHDNWPGVFSAIDVVNESVNDNTGGFRTEDNEWYNTFGDDSYVMKAFELARKYTLQYNEPQIKLYYNDYSTHSPVKADGIVTLVTPIFQAGLLDGIGMQEHDQISSPTAAQWITSYEKFYPVCTEMSVTEIDVSTGSGNPSAAILQQQANQYGQLFKCFVERSYFSGRGKIINVTKDGLNDQYTFRTNQSSSIWDSRNQCKPSFYAIADVGIYYNKLDSLTALSDSLRPSDYDSQAWTAFSSVLTYAKTEKERTYNISTSAAFSLHLAADSLEHAFNSLVNANSVGDDVTAPSAFRLDQNYPNPFNPVSVIGFNLPYSGIVKLSLYDMLGNEVGILAEGECSSGYHQVKINAAALASGTYFYRLQSGIFSSTRKMILMK